MLNTGTIYGINGPVVTVKDADCFEMMEMVHVGDQNLVGEVIGITSDFTTIQVYEETSGLGPGEPVETTGAPLSVELGPGLIESIFDGIQRPLTKIRELVGERITRGVEVPALDREARWNFEPRVKVGDAVVPGTILGVVQENTVVEHRIMVPRGVSGEVLEMRARMAQHKPAKGPLDVKLARGGLVDAEFITHYLQLRHGKALVPSLGQAIAEIAALQLVPAALMDAHAVLTRFLIAARLLAPDAAEPPPAARDVLAHACGCGDWNALREALAESRRTVVACWQSVFGETLEID